jgi:hypothetical protein
MRSNLFWGVIFHDYKCIISWWHYCGLCRWSKCEPVLNWIFPSKAWFFFNLFEFSAAEITSNSISLTFWIQNLTKQIPLNPAHQDLSDNTKGTFQFLQNFQVRFNLIFSEKLFHIQELLHCKSKHHETKPMYPCSSRAFQRNQERDLKHPGWVDLIST